MLMKKNEIILNVKELYKSYRIHNETTLRVLQGIDFDVKAGEMVQSWGRQDAERQL